MRYKSQIDVLSRLSKNLTEIKETLEEQREYQNKVSKLSGTDQTVVEGYDSCLDDKLNQINDELKKNLEAINYLKKTDVLDIHFARDHILNVPREEAIRRANKMKDCMDTLRH